MAVARTAGLAVERPAPEVPASLSTVRVSPPAPVLHPAATVAGVPRPVSLPPVEPSAAGSAQERDGRTRFGLAGRAGVVGATAATAATALTIGLAILLRRRANRG
jgi:hypothetical protein